MSILDVRVPPGSEALFDLPWDVSLPDWPAHLFVELPRGISRHEVRFVPLGERLFVVKELPTAAATNDFEVLQALEQHRVPTVHAIGLITGRTDDPTEEASAALITEYSSFSFSYRELLQGAGFGDRRNQLLDAFAGLLVELHLTGCFWGDCSLSNVLYRFDADRIMAIMVDAETAELREQLSDGQREHDLMIMIENVAGGMADIATWSGRPLDDADLDLGEDIAERYRRLWEELTGAQWMGKAERWQIKERIQRLNSLGFEVESVEIRQTETGEELVLVPTVGQRSFHRHRLQELTGLNLLEFQARQILSDLQAHLALVGEGSRHAAALDWRFSTFEPWLDRLRSTEGVDDPVQAYCDLLWFRWDASVHAERSVSTDEAFELWLVAGRPGYPAT